MPPPPRRPPAAQHGASGHESGPPGTIPPAIIVFLGYAFLILGGIGLSLRFVVDMAVAAPVSPVGLVVMALLAYDIFTITLVLQRKEAARNLALGLASLTVPAVPLAALAGAWPVAVVLTALGLLLFRGLTGQSARAWLSEP